MPDDATKLISALAERDRLRAFVSRLRKLELDGEVTAEQAASAHGDYDQRISAATSAIESLRPLVESRLAEVRGELDATRLELSRLQARYKVGELTAQKFQGEEKRLRTRVTALEADEAALAQAAAADTAAGLELPSATARTRPEKTPRMRAENDERPRKTQSIAPSAGIPRRWIRIAALAVAVLLLLSIRLPWLGASDLLGEGLPTEPGVSVSFLAGLGGLICGLGGIGAYFLKSGQMRGTTHVVFGVATIAALLAAMFLRELPLHDSYFRSLVTLQAGLYLYVAAGIALAVAGFLERRESA